MTKPIVLTVDKIIDTLVEDHNIALRDATDFVETWVDDIKAAITEGQRVKFAGLGSLALQEGNKVRQLRKKKLEMFDETLGLDEKWKVVALSVSPDIKARAARAALLAQRQDSLLSD